MRNILYISLFAFTLTLSSCEGSDIYRGKWKATNGDGIQSEISFTPTEMTIIERTGDSGKWEYSQNSVNIESGRRKYGIQLEDGPTYTIIFPIKDNQERGAILDENAQIAFIIGRTEYYSYDDVFGIN